MKTLLGTGKMYPWTIDKLPSLQTWKLPITSRPSRTVQPNHSILITESGEIRLPKNPKCITFLNRNMSTRVPDYLAPRVVTLHVNFQLSSKHVLQGMALTMVSGTGSILSCCSLLTVPTCYNSVRVGWPVEFREVFHISTYLYLLFFCQVLFIT